MADNIAITAGTGTSVATDDCGAAGHTQIIKLANSTDGSATLVPASSTDGLLVNLGANNDVTITSGTVTTVSTVTTLSQFGGNAINLGAGAVGTGTLRTTLASDDPAVAKLGTIDADTSGLFGCVAGTEVQCDIVGSLPAGTNNIGDVDVLSVPSDPFGANADAASATGSISAKLRFIAATGIPITGTVTIAGAVTNAGTFAVQPSPAASNGLSIFRSLDLDESEEEVKGSAGCIYKIRIANASTSARYVKVYDNTAAGTTVGTTTPIDTIVVPGATSASQPTVITEAYGGLGITCSTGITVAATTALADADTGAPSANDVVCTVLYK